MTEPSQRPQYWREEAQISGLGIKINIRRVVDYNCERGRSAKSVKRLEVTLAAYRCHRTLPTVESLKRFGEQGAWRTWKPRSRAGFLSVDFTMLSKVIRRCARERLRWVTRRLK
jgi:hypothetical protein